MSEQTLCLHVDDAPLGLVCNITWAADTLAGTQTKISRQAMAQRARVGGCDRLVLAKERFGFLDHKRMRHVTLGKATRGPARRGKCLSLAALAANALDDGVAVLCLSQDEGSLYWVWASRAKTLSARADRVLSSREEALELAESIAQGLGLADPMVLGPDESLAFLRDLAGRAARERVGEAAILPLEPVSPGRVILIVLVALVAAGLLAGGQTMWEWWETRARTTLLSQTREELAKRRADIQRNPEKYFDISWQKKPSAASFVLAVVQGMLAHPLAGNGWALQELTGTAQTLSARWKALSAAILLYPPGEAVNDLKKPGYATQTTPQRFTLPKGAITRENLLPEGEARRILAEIATRFGLRLRLSFEKPEFVMVGETRVEAPWVRGTVRLAAIPDYVVNDYPSFARAVDMPGLAFKAISWDGRSWSVEGSLVVRR